MSSPLTTPLPNYKPATAPETAFSRARQIVDDREGSHILRANHWRLAAFGSLCTSLVLSVGLIVQSTKARIEPYVVEVMNGEQVRVIKGAAQSDYRPKPAFVEKALKEWLVSVRSISSDPIVVRNNWLKAYKFVTPKGKVQLDAFAQSEDPFSLVGVMTRSVQEIHVSHIPHSQSYRVEWLEQTWTVSGVPQGEPQSYLGTHTLETLKPKTAQALEDNPLGVYVDGFEWTLMLNNGEE